MFRFYPILPTSRLAIRVLPDDISRRVFTRILKLFNKNGRGAAPSLIINTRINNKSEENNLSYLVSPIILIITRSILALGHSRYSKLLLNFKKKRKMFLKWSKLGGKKKQIWKKPIRKGHDSICISNGGS